MEETLAIAFGYALGSVPFAFLVSRWQGIDLRLVGSGNVGATNVLRTSGVVAGVLAMVLDVLKGWLAVLVAQAIATAPAAPVAAGVASIVGHVYPVWLGFRGGKGVATAAGVFLLLAPAALAIAVGVFVAVASITRYVSVGSLAGTLMLAAMTAARHEPRRIAVGAFVTAALIFYRHRGNIARLVAGSERRIGERPF